MLRRLWDKVEPTKAATLESAFRTTGLCPFNPDKVLEKLPRTGTNVDQDREFLNTSVIELLSEKREWTKEPKKKRGRKIDAGDNLAAAGSSSREPIPPRASSSQDSSKVASGKEKSATKPAPTVGVPSKVKLVNSKPSRILRQREIVIGLSIPDPPAESEVINELKLQSSAANTSVDSTDTDDCTECNMDYTTYKGPDWSCCLVCRLWFCSICYKYTLLFTCKSCINY